jgi:hypothetical protein
VAIAAIALPLALPHNARAAASKSAPFDYGIACVANTAPTLPGSGCQVVDDPAATSGVLAVGGSAVTAATTGGAAGQSVAGSAGKDTEARWMGTGIRVPTGAGGTLRATAAVTVPINGLHACVSILPEGAKSSPPTCNGIVLSTSARVPANAVYVVQVTLVNSEAFGFSPILTCPAQAGTCIGSGRSATGGGQATVTSITAAVD